MDNPTGAVDGLSASGPGATSWDEIKGSVTALLRAEDRHLQ